MRSCNHVDVTTLVYMELVDNCKLAGLVKNDDLIYVQDFAAKIVDAFSYDSTLIRFLMEQDLRYATDADQF